MIFDNHKKQKLSNDRKGQNIDIHFEASLFKTEND